MIDRDYLIKKYNLTINKDGFYADEHGTVWALPSSSKYKDNDIRLGVGILNLPSSYYLTPAARAHDYAYDCPVWQANYSRKETDDLFRLHVRKLGGTYMEELLLYGAVRIFGGLFYEKNEDG